MKSRFKNLIGKHTLEYFSCTCPVPNWRITPRMASISRREPSMDKQLLQSFNHVLLSQWSWFYARLHASNKIHIYNTLLHVFFKSAAEGSVSNTLHLILCDIHWNKTMCQTNIIIDWTGGPIFGAHRTRSPFMVSFDLWSDFWFMKQIAGAFQGTADELLFLWQSWSTTVSGLKSQITQFENKTLPELESLFNDTTEFASYISGSIFVVHTGANDYEQRCFLSTLIQQCDVPMFTGYLLNYLTQQLEVCKSSSLVNFSRVSSNSWKYVLV